MKLWGHLHSTGICQWYLETKLQNLVQTGSGSKVARKCDRKKTSSQFSKVLRLALDLKKLNELNYKTTCSKIWIALLQHIKVGLSNTTKHKTQFNHCLKAIQFFPSHLCLFWLRRQSLQYGKVNLCMFSNLFFTYPHQYSTHP